MSKDITPYVKSKLPKIVLLRLYNARKYTYPIIFLLVLIVLVIGWFVLNKNISLILEWVLASLIGNALVTFFVYVVIRTETNPYKSSWIQLFGLLSFCIGFIYTTIEMIIIKEVGLQLILIASIFSMISLQRFARYDVDEDDT